MQGSSLRARVFPPRASVRNSGCFFHLSRIEDFFIQIANQHVQRRAAAQVKSIACPPDDRLIGLGDLRSIQNSHQNPSLAKPNDERSIKFSHWLDARKP
jgi:hypothetical protein